MISDIRYVKLSDHISTFNKGITPKYSVTATDTIVLNQKCIRDGKIDFSLSQFIEKDQSFSDLKIVKVGDILINSTGQGTAGRSAFVDKLPLQTVVDSHMLIVRINDKKWAKILAYCLYQNEELLLTMLTGSSGQGELNNDIVFNNIQFPFSDHFNLDFGTQLLRLLDDKIALNQNINVELEQTARMIYDYWFTQFDFPNKHNKPYRTTNGAMVYSEKLKRNIPAGWRIDNLLNIVDWIGGAQPPKSTFKYKPAANYVRFIQNRDYADSQNLTYIPNRKSNKLCTEMDIMMDKYGDAGVTRFGIEGAYNVALSRIEVRLEDGQEYVRKFLESEQIYNYLHNACLASTRASLNEEILGNLYLVVPDRDVLKEFENQMKLYMKQILQNRNESMQLAQLRDWLLPMLMNGQVNVT